MAFQAVIVRFDVVLHKESQSHHAENSHIIRVGVERPILLTQDTACEPEEGMYYPKMKAGSYAYPTPDGKLACRKHFNLHFPTVEQLKRRYLEVKQYQNIQFSS